MNLKNTEHGLLLLRQWVKNTFSDVVLFERYGV